MHYLRLFMPLILPFYSHYAFWATGSFPSGLFLSSFHILSYVALASCAFTLRIHLDFNYDSQILLWLDLFMSQHAAYTTYVAVITPACKVDGKQRRFNGSMQKVVGCE